MNEEIKTYPEAIVGALVYNDKGEVLLIKGPKFGDFWTIPGGHIELNEKAEDALKREIKEELSLEIKNIEPIGFSDGISPKFYHKKKHFVFLNYLAEISGGEIKESNEMTEYIWVAPEKVSELKTSDTIGLVEQYLERKKNDKETWENKYLRALADYQNLLKQTVKEKEEFAKYALTDFLHNVLPVYDHLKMSMYGLSEEEGKNAWAEGVRHVLKQFRDVLATHGIEEIKTMGEKFDHNTMDAIDGKGENVKQEVMPGYKLNGKVIRAAKVIVE